VRYVERDPVQVIVGTTGDELVHNTRSFVGESRGAFAVVRPDALAVCDLGGGACGRGAQMAAKTAARSRR
jgi:hypothetical protein